MTKIEPIILNPEGREPGLIVVDHAGTDLPASLVARDFARQWRNTHHFTDLGVAALAEALAERLDMPVILSTVSRLVIDLNRWLDDPRSILSSVEGLPLDGNTGISTSERQLRHESVFWPYHETVGRIWARQLQKHQAPIFFALHSCTRNFLGIRRQWDAGTIWHDDRILSQNLLASLGRSDNLILGDNQPYSGIDGAYTVDRHTFGSGIPACGFEVSNDLLETDSDRKLWARRLADALRLAAETRCTI
ncbi:N-formylglutamate amidohydrolase [Paracoccus onubensis]|uniref:N-formylglutamate amidohydrolase n=1 Tax=Paracoccus onubensis TaxID=1675788 RepID=UPI00272F1BCD|nr:N-formylglutamate amidohydrolase [Paracoccus onubensis]MDP0927052.1 N-formylglutamate amidohydrolase [Paracoccus onubensis]